ncbi:MAG: ATP-dependent helicase [Kiritimatiellae bacterium]|nr:ATP-dependent helicase [Kiritimatiellia bacterium]
MTTDLLAELNDQQRAAVTAPDGPALVIAAAGTGKTRTLTHRVAWLVQEHDVRPWQILLLTFTNRAAREMLERAGQLLRGGIESIWGGTFHSVANRMLRHHAERLGYDRNFTILDEDDSSHLLKECIADLGLSGKEQKFPKPDVLLGLFGLASSRKANLGETLANRFTAPDANINGMLEVHKTYTERKRKNQYMDFDDLLIYALRLLQECPDVAQQYGNTFRYVLIDEYQDTSRIQSDFVDLLAATHNNLMAVGDDFQSIYSWRGADIDNFLDFESRHPGARIYKLERNYRSVPGILEVANDVIAGNKDQYQKTLVPHRPGGVKPTLVHLSDGRHQARYVVDKISELVDSGVVRPNEIAVLYRAHFHAMELQLELNRNQRIPYTVVSGVRFFEQAHIKDVCAPLVLATNPASDIAFKRWMQLLPKIGQKRAASMWAKLGGSLDLHDPAARIALSAALPADARPVWQKLETALFPDGTADLLDHPTKFIEIFVKAFYADYLENAFDNPRTRQEDIMELSSFSSQYSSTATFLEAMPLQTNLDSSGRQTSNVPTDGVRLTTVHQAKGLEWKVVFVLWMVHGMFPSARALDEPGTMAEERRLFYVAVTRAKDSLWLCVPNLRRIGGPHGDLQYCAPSEFIEGIQATKLRTERPVTPAPAWRDYNW